MPKRLQCNLIVYGPLFDFSWKYQERYRLSDTTTIVLHATPVNTYSVDDKVQGTSKFSINVVIFVLQVITIIRRISIDCFQTSFDRAPR